MHATSTHIATLVPFCTLSGIIVDMFVNVLFTSSLASDYRLDLLARRQATLWQLQTTEHITT